MPSTVLFVANCIQSDGADPSGGAIPGIRGVDHFGVTVPDMEQAEDFFVDILGAVPVYSLPGKSAEDNWMADHLGVHPRTAISEIRFYRIANGGNIEVFTYDAADGQAPPPRNSDIGGHHLALYVDDIDRAVDYLRSRGVEVMGEPIASTDASLGQRWVYFRAPWGLQFELVSYPNGKAYESTTDVRLWHPVHDSR